MMRHGLSIPARLLILAIACSAPIGIFATYVAYRSVDREYDSVRQNVFVRVQLLSERIDNHLEEVQQKLVILAGAPVLKAKNFALFQEYAADANKLIGGIAIVLVDRSGQQHVNTALPVGTALPRRSNLDTQEQVFVSGEPRVSDLIVGTATSRPLVSVEVPVQLEGEQYVLATGLTPELFAGLLAGQNLPPEWRIGLSDRKRAIIARIPDPQKFVGQPAGGVLSRRIGEEGRWVESTTLDHVPVYGTYVVSSRSGWTTAIGVPRATFDLPYRDVIISTTTFAVLAFILSLLAARLASRLISNPLNRLQSAANSLGNGDPLPDSSTGVTEVDVVHTAMRKAGERQQLLLDELNHRVKNTLATVQSIAYLSLKTAKSLPDFGVSFEKRLISLATTHNLLRENDWQGSSIGSVLQDTLAAYMDGARIKLTCEDGAHLNPKSVLTLASVIHELATNAVKYGALSVPGGHIEIHCAIEDPKSVSVSPTIVIRWSEIGGPPISAPLKQGFGTRFIETVVKSELHGTVEQMFLPSGLVSLLRIPVVAS
jgi:two-component sensor histidine kinase